MVDGLFQRDQLVHEESLSNILWRGTGTGVLGSISSSSSSSRQKCLVVGLMLIDHHRSHWLLIFYFFFFFFFLCWFIYVLLVFSGDAEAPTPPNKIRQTRNWPSK